MVLAGRRVWLRLGVAVVVSLSVMLVGAQEAFAADCPNGSGGDCFVATTYWNGGFITWPMGVQATFPTRDGALYGIKVNSTAVVNLYSPGGTWINFVEVGWFRSPTRNRFQSFYVNQPNGAGSYYELDGVTFVGEATATYNVGYQQSSNTWQYQVILNGVSYPATGTVTGWHTGYPEVNAERHDYRDTWSPNPDFTSLWVLSSSPHWSLWPSAVCIANGDPSYVSQTQGINPIEVQIVPGSGYQC